MRVRIVALGIAAWLLGTVGSPLAQQREIDAERGKLQGRWVLVSGEADGASVPRETVERSTLTFDGDRIAIDNPQQFSAPMVERLTRLDPTKTPREMHWVRTTGPKAGIPLMGVYQFQGDDQFKICFDPSGRAAPKDLTAKAGTGHVCNVWRRAKP